MANEVFLKNMAADTCTEYWNDSCSEQELDYAIKNGASGATSNPIIVGKVFAKEQAVWTDYIRELMGEKPHYSETDLLWNVNEAMVVRGAKQLLPVFEKSKKMKGRISIQVNPQYYRSSKNMVEQALHFHDLAENIQVKIPATPDGIIAIEEATYKGVNVNATVSFSVPQAVMVGEAIENGLKRRSADGFDISSMRPVCTIMAGRADDWFKAVCDKNDIIVDPECLEWGGVAIIKRAYDYYQEHKFSTRLLIAAFRNHYQMTEFIGGDIIATIPLAWQKKFNSNPIDVADRIGVPVDKKLVDILLKRVPDFKRMYEPDGMVFHDLESLGPQILTLREFLSGYYELVGKIREVMLPSPL